MGRWKKGEEVSRCAQVFDLLSDVLDICPPWGFLFVYIRTAVQNLLGCIFFTFSFPVHLGDSGSDFTTVFDSDDRPPVIFLFSIPIKASFAYWS